MNSCVWCTNCPLPCLFEIAIAQNVVRSDIEHFSLVGENSYIPESESSG